MPFYFAPMEGITGYVYRNAHQSCFGYVDQYVTPFIVPNQNKCFSSRERNDVLPEHNQSVRLVPQLLTNQAEAFIWAGQELERMGYREINLNLGCPSATVVSKYRGAGFLAKPKELDQFLDRIFSSLSVSISVKTRIGIQDPDEFLALLTIFNQYPIKELMIHPRLQQDFYRNSPNLQVFSQSLENSKNPVCYNGDLFTQSDIQAFCQRFPDTHTIMLGRGLLVNPGLCRQIKTGQTVTIQELREFHRLIYQGYSEILSGDRNLLFKMKELWSYLLKLLEGSDRWGKKLKKAQRPAEYWEAVNGLLETCTVQTENIRF